MKKLTTIFGLLVMMVIVTSFTTPDTGGKKGPTTTMLTSESGGKKDPTTTMLTSESGGKKDPIVVM